MIEEIGTAAPMDVALLGAFTLILWDLLRERRRGWLRVVAAVLGEPRKRLFDGLLANDKFCMIRHARLSLSHSRRPNLTHSQKLT